MKYSVIIPLYNKEHFIASTIKSVLAQTYSDFEIIIIDDGSTDNSLAVAKTFCDKRIKIIEKENGGVSSARNLGISIAKGEYISFLDADDKWHQDFLFEIDKLIQGYNDYSFFCVAQYKRKIQIFKHDVTIIEDHCKYPYIYSSCSLCIKKDVFDNISGFREGIQRGEDLDEWLKISCKYHTVYLNKELVDVNHFTENNLSREIDVMKTFPFWEWYEYDYPIKSSLYKYTTDEIIKSIYVLLKQKRYSEAWYMYKKIKGYHSIKHRTYILFKLFFRK